MNSNSSWTENSLVYDQVILLVFAVVLFFSFLNTAVAREYAKIEIHPQDVGVFAEVGKQQFTAYGVTLSGDKENITDQVDWYLAERPFRLQVLTKNMTPNDIAQINANGLLTIKENITWGRVAVTACYPKGCGAGLTDYSGAKLLNMPALSYLLQPKYMVTPNHGANGSIRPATAISVIEGRTAYFVVTPDQCYEISAVDCTCGGTLNGATFITGPVTADCSVSAVFSHAGAFYTATPIALNGTNDPGDIQTVSCGNCVDFIFGPPDTSGDVAVINAEDSCGGILSDNKNETWTYTISSLTRDCDAVVSFVTEFTVHTMAAGGTEPDPVTALPGTALNLTFGPADIEGNVAQVDIENDDCSGMLSDNGDGTWNYNIASLTGNCTAAVEFVPPPQFTLTVEGTSTGASGQVIGGVLGTVDSNIVITCPLSLETTCNDSAILDNNLTVELNAYPGDFVTWGRDCSFCSTQTTCSITMDGDKTCTAEFNP